MLVLPDAANYAILSAVLTYYHRNRGYIMQNVAQSLHPEREKKLWQRREDEKPLWYNRFKRYLDLGPKRSIQAAFEQERGQVKALKSTKKQQKRHLAAVAQVQVPGSWKAASVKYQWVERARAYDTSIVDTMTERWIEVYLAEDYTLVMDRVTALRALFDTTLKNYNANNHLMTFEQVCAFIARLQSLLRDIREEMKLYDRDFHAKVGKRRLAAKYLAGEEPFKRESK